MNLAVAGIWDDSGYRRALPPFNAHSCDAAPMLSRPCSIGSMNIHELLQTLSDRIAASAKIKNVHGEPVTVGNRTVIPVARVTLGFGGGAGEEKGAKEGHGGGGGGGVAAEALWCCGDHEG